MALKGILFGIVFLLTFLIFLTIPTYLIFTFWVYLSELKTGKNPIYTFALLSIFAYAVVLLVALIYIVAMFRAFIHCKDEKGLGIPKGVKGFGLVSTIIVVSIMIIWYLLFNEIAFFILKPPTE